MSALTFSDGKPNTGFGFALNGSYVSAKYTEPGVANELGSYSLDGYALWSSAYTDWQDKDVKVTPAVEQANVNVGLSGTPQQYQVKGLATGESTCEKVDKLIIVYNSKTSRDHPTNTPPRKPSHLISSI